MESTTIVKITKADRDKLARCCAECSIPCYFYSIENNDNMLQAEIESTSPVILFNIGKMLGLKYADKILF
jgi:hypothetical protein